MKRLFVAYRKHLNQFGFHSPALFLKIVRNQLVALIPSYMHAVTTAHESRRDSDMEEGALLELRGWIDLVDATLAIIEDDRSFVLPDEYQTPWMRLLERVRNHEAFKNRRDRKLARSPH